MTDRTGLELRSLITSAGELTLSLDEVAVPDPGPGKVVVRIEASPLNPRIERAKALRGRQRAAQTAVRASGAQK